MCVMGLMPRGPVSLVLLFAVALAAAGGALAALPPPPTVSVPTVTVPLPPPPLPLPVPLPPPPTTITVPPKAEVPPAPPAPPPQIDPPAAPVVPAALPPRLATSSADYASRGGRTTSRKETSKQAKPSTSRGPTSARAATKPRAGGVKGAAASTPSRVQGRPAEGAGFFGPIGTAFNALDVPREVVPTALFAMAALAILLLGLASAPIPARTSRTGAMIVHMRGSIGLAGTAALLMAVASYFLLL